MGIEGGSGNNEIQSQEINQANNEQIEQNNAEHQRSGEQLEANSTIDNEGERKQVEGKDDATDNTESESENNLDDQDTIDEGKYENDIPQESENLTDNNSELNQQQSLENEQNSDNSDESELENNENELDDNGTIENSLDDDSIDDDKESDDKNELDNASELENNQNSENKEDESESSDLDDNNSIEDNIEDENPEDNATDENPEDNIEDENVADSTEDEKPEDFVAKDVDNKNDTSESDGNAEVSSDIKESLEPFEQNDWDSLSPEQQKEAITDLRDSISNDLELENKPDVKFYDNNDDTDFGGYSPSENAIYINEHNMGDAAETADTIAHESRHCWQHERAENPQNEQDLAFKENFDDYIRPEDDYRGYKNQPVEADAREYASDIANSIPKQSNEDSSHISNEITQNPSSDEIRNKGEEKGTVFDVSDIPADLNNKVGEAFDSKVKEPESYNSKFEHDTQQKLEDYYKKDAGNLNEKDKQELVTDLKNSYDGTLNDKKGNTLVPEDAKDVTSIYYDKNAEKYDIGYDWKSVDTVPSTRKMEVLKEGQQFDRVGAPTGRCTGAVDESGNCATIKERSIPYHFTESDITKEPSYHRYEAEQDFTKENINNAIDNSSFSDDKRQEMHDKVDAYYEKSERNGYGSGDGLATGEIAPMFEDTTGATGGGKQYDMPLNMNELEDIGMISEIPRSEY